MAIENIRLQNLQKQIKQKSERIQVSSTLAYQETDSVTGSKKLVSADGSVVYANYLSNSQPGEIITSYDGKNVNQPATNTDPTRRFGNQF